jgi:PhoPQ-activated pathogenicity-related protein
VRTTVILLLSTPLLAHPFHIVCETTRRCREMIVAYPQMTAGQPLQET